MTTHTFCKPLIAVLQRSKNKHVFPLLSYLMRISTDTALYCKVYENSAGLDYSTSLGSVSWVPHQRSIPVRVKRLSPKTSSSKS